MASGGVFWGVVVKPGEPCKLEAPDGPYQIHLSQAVVEQLAQASLADDAKNNQKASLMISTDDQEIVLCNLRERTCENVALDLILDQELSFTAKGNVAVHLSGYYMPVVDEESGDEYSDEFSSDEDGLHLIHGHDSDELTTDGEENYSDDDSEEEDTKSHRPDVEIKELGPEDEPEAQAALAEEKKAQKTPATGTKRKAEEAKATQTTINKQQKQGKQTAPEGATAQKQKPVEKPVTATPKTAEAPKAPATSSKTPKTRTFPNGFEITTTKQGLPDAKLAKTGKTVVVKYVGRLKSNSKVFDSTKGNKTFNFRLGVGEVIKGWDRGVEGMRVGEKRRLIIPPQMGYGSTGAGKVIPPNAWLDFDVELVNVRG